VLMDCRADNPNRVPDWIWQRAQQAFSGDGPGPTARRDGPEYARWISKARSYIRLRAGCQTDSQQNWLIDRFPDLHWAAYTFEHPEISSRAQIEARLLARQNDVEIATATGCSPGMIQAFEKLFFNVRERLNNPDYIFATVLRDIHHGIDDRRYPVIWKLFGYTMGPGILEALIRKIPIISWTKNLESAAAACQDVSIANMKMKGMLASTLVPVSPQNQLELLHILTKYIEIERTTGEGGAGEQTLITNIQVLLGNLPFQVGGIGKRSGALQAYDDRGIDLHTDEQLLLAAGMKPPSLALLEHMEVPVAGK
jgi:hypothetical protein